MLKLPSFGVRLTDLTNGLMTREWYRFFQDLYIEVLSMNSDFMLNVSRGLITGMSSVNKWGRAPSGMQTTLTDIWDRADATPTQQIWLCPTAARIHAIVSTSANDDGAPAGTGARTVTVYGLTSWSTAEVSEVVTLNGVGAVNTVNAYVIIHRMVVTTFGAAGPNVGTITATAATDATVTAAILPGNGRTEMAIYGVPSSQTAYLTRFHASMNDSGATSRADFYGKIATDPANFPAVLVLARTFCMTNTGTGTYSEEFNPPMRIPGPAILKLSGVASAADIDSSGGFDLILIDN